MTKKIRISECAGDSRGNLSGEKIVWLSFVGQLSERFPRDYNLISRDKRSGIGCGIGACRDSSELNEFNYLHPTWHPFYNGRQVHTLQSVTKSVTATLIGIALYRKEIKNVSEPLLSFFDAYDLSKVDPRLHKATLADLLTMRSGIEWHESDRPLDSHWGIAAQTDAGLKPTCIR